MKSKDNYISLSRVVSAFAVVMIHTNGNCFYEFNVERCWFISNLLSAILCFAVPVFLMITGATLIDYSERYSTKEYLKKRAEKIVIPFLFWGCLVGYLYKTYTDKMDAYLLYNFLIWLIGIYLAIPVFSYIQKEHRENVVLYVVGISFVINYLLPFICKVFDVSCFYEIPFEVAQQYFIYPLVGYIVAKKDISPKFRYLSYFLSAFSLGLMVFGTYVRSMIAGKIDDVFLGYPNLPCLVYSVGIFIFLKQIGSKIKNEKFLVLVEKISGYTFSIYLIHWYIIYFAIAPWIQNTHTLLYKFVAPIVVFGISILLVYVLRKIPILRKLFP